MAIDPKDQPNRTANRDPDHHDTALDRIVRQIEPPGREVSDEELKDPGRSTPTGPVTDNRS